MTDSKKRRVCSVETRKKMSKLHIKHYKEQYPEINIQIEDKKLLEKHKVI